MAAQNGALETDSYGRGLRRHDRGGATGLFLDYGRTGFAGWSPATVDHSRTRQRVMSPFFT